MADGIPCCFLLTYTWGSGGTGGTLFSIPSGWWSAFILPCADVSLPPLGRRGGGGLLLAAKSAEDMVVAVVGNDCDSCELGVPVALAEEEDSRFGCGGIRARGIGIAGISSVKSIQLLSGEPVVSLNDPILGFKGILLSDLLLLLSGMATATATATGVPGRELAAEGPPDDLPLALFFPGVLVSPSSFLNASSTFGSNSFGFGVVLC